MHRALDGQVAIVTGAGRGMGRAHALRLATEGAKVLVNDYGGDSVGNPGTSAPAEAVAEEIRAAGGVAIADGHDVGTSAEDIVSHAVGALGGLDIVVNNAAIVQLGGFEDLTREQFEQTMRVDFFGLVGVCRAAWPIFKAQQYGRIVNVSSNAVFGVERQTAYAAAKAAVLGFTRCLAWECPGGVRVNAIMPKAQTRLSLAGFSDAAAQAAYLPEKVATFVAALVSPSVPVSGETFVVGAGRAARVVLATVEGATDLSDVDAVLDRFGDVMATNSFFVPAGTAEAVSYEYGCLGLQLPPGSGQDNGPASSAVH
jgi:NAD(P)-dependent dehydrogenase (short-subunit alcohol dehydrogenase family)